MKKKNEAEKLKRRSFTCNDADWAWLEEAALQQEITLPQFIRRLIRLVRKG